MGRPLFWEQKLRCPSRSCGLLEQLDLDIKFDLIKDEDLGRYEPDCETNNQ